MHLRSLAASAGLDIGACASAEDLTDETCATVLGTEFNRLALENDLKWGRVRPERDVFDFEGADRLLDFADRHDMAVTGHALVWHEENPDWLVQRNWHPSDLAVELRAHIHRVTDRYADRIDTWDVVNEAVDDSGHLRESLWLEGLGEEYIANAFRWASDHSDADLFYNEYGLPYNDAKRERVYRLLESLLDRGVPVDGIGLQLHCVGVHPGPERIRGTIQRFQELGLSVRITEFDLAYHNDEAPEHIEAAQAQYYRETVEACLDEGVEHVTFWGVIDDRSWITSWRDYPDRYTQQPLLFDDEGRAKPSAEAVASVLRDHGRE
jgi:endo-1,4-beta-xylanase